MRNFIVLSLCLLSFNQVKAEVKNRSQVARASQEQPAGERTDSGELSEDSIGVKKIVGMASWYSYKGGLFAASTGFKKGSVLRIINPANDKYVDVIVNDYGPDRKKHPNRIIDLDEIAFQKIADLETGIIDIIICPLKTL